MIFFEKKSQVFGVLGQKWTNYGKNEVFQVYQKSVCGNVLILTMQFNIIKLKFDSNEFLGKSYTMVSGYKDVQNEILKFSSE